MIARSTVGPGIAPPPSGMTEVEYHGDLDGYPITATFISHEDGSRTLKGARLHRNGQDLVLADVGSCDLRWGCIFEELKKELGENITNTGSSEKDCRWNKEGTILTMHIKTKTYEEGWSNENLMESEVAFIIDPQSRREQLFKEVSRILRMEVDLGAVTRNNVGVSFRFGNDASMICIEENSQPGFNIREQTSKELCHIKNSEFGDSDLKPETKQRLLEYIKEKTKDKESTHQRWKSTLPTEFGPERGWRGECMSLAARLDTLLRR